MANRNSQSLQGIRPFRFNHPARVAERAATFQADHAYGSAEDAVAYVEQLREAGADETMCLIQMGTVPQEACMETIRQWGEKVIPRFRGDGPRAPAPVRTPDTTHEGAHS